MTKILLFRLQFHVYMRMHHIVNYRYQTVEAQVHSWVSSCRVAKEQSGWFFSEYRGLLTWQ